MHKRCIISNNLISNIYIYIYIYIIKCQLISNKERINWQNIACWIGSI